jgi:hypothetical protein
MHTWAQSNIRTMPRKSPYSTTLQFSVPFGESYCMLSLYACASSCMGESVMRHVVDYCQYPAVEL